MLESVLRHPKIETLELEIFGLSPLLVQNWHSKALKPTGCCYGRKPRSDKERMLETFLDSLYIIDRRKLPRRPIGPGKGWPFVKGVFGVPLGMFHKSMKVASRAGNSLFTLEEGLVPIRYSKLVCEATPVSVGIGPRKVYDVRIRGKFEGWSTRIKINFDSNRISGNGVLGILREAGKFIGIGALRPDAGGDYGRFEAAPVMKSV